MSAGAASEADAPVPADDARNGPALPEHGRAIYRAGAAAFTAFSCRDATMPAIAITTSKDSTPNIARIVVTPIRSSRAACSTRRR